MADHDRVYVGTSGQTGQKVVALDRETGTIAWRNDVGGKALAVHENRLYVAAYEQASAFDPATGETLWSTPLPPIVEPNLLVADDQVFVAGRRLVALDAGSGDTRWERSGGQSAIADGALVTLDRSSILRRHSSRRISDLVTAAPPPVAWEVALDREGTPVVATDRVFVGTHYDRGDLGLSAVALDSGDVDWVLETDTGEGHAAIGPPAVAGGRGFADLNFGESGGTNFQDLVPVSLDVGEIDWRQAIETDIFTVIVAGDTVLAATGALEDAGAGDWNGVSGGLQAFTLDGATQWQFDVDVPAYSLGAVDDTIYVGTSAFDGTAPGHVYALT